SRVSVSLHDCAPVPSTTLFRSAHMREQLVAAENERKIAVTGGSPEEIAQLESDLVKTNAEIDRLRSERDSLERLYLKQAATRQEDRKSTRLNSSHEWI